jgi:hypothetical protein
MNQINWGRFVAGAILAGVLAFFLDGLLHSVFLRPQWMALAAASGQEMSQRDPTIYVYYVLYDLAKGVFALWLYVSMRKQFGVGVMTAALAGVTLWALTIPIPLCGQIPFHWFGRKVALLWAVYGLVPTVLFTVAGAWLYKELKTAAPA